MSFDVMRYFNKLTRLVDAAADFNRYMTVHGSATIHAHCHRRHSIAYTFEGRNLTAQVTSADSITVYDLNTGKRVRRCYMPELVKQPLPYSYMVPHEGGVAVVVNHQHGQQVTKLFRGEKLLVTPEVADELSIITNGRFMRFTKREQEQLQIIRDFDPATGKPLVCLDSDLDDRDFWFELDVRYPEMEKLEA